MQQFWSEWEQHRPRGPHSSCRSPGGGRCGCTPPCSWAPPDTTGTQHWGTASVPSVPGQRGRAPTADTHMHLSWNVCPCIHALCQVKREEHQLHTHTHTHTHVLDICLCTDLESGQRGRAANAHRYKQRESDTDIDTHAQTHISMCMYKDRQMQCAR